jgi:hypothetical protein
VLVRNLKECPEFIAGDGCSLRELLNAGKGALAFLCIVDPAWRKDDETV